MNLRGLVATILASALFVPAHTSPRPEGEQGPRVVGIVYCADTGAPFGHGDVIAEVLNRQDVHDSTDDDGIFCLSIPKGLKNFRIAFRASGYWSQATDMIAGDKDPEKLHRIILRKRLAPMTTGDVSQILEDLKGEYVIFEDTPSSESREKIRFDLVGYQNKLSAIKGGSAVVTVRKEVRITLDKMASIQKPE